MLSQPIEYVVPISLSTEPVPVSAVPAQPSPPQTHRILAPSPSSTSIINMRAGSTYKVENFFSFVHSYLGTCTIRTFVDNMLKLLRIYHFRISDNPDWHFVTLQRTVYVHLPLDVSAIILSADKKTASLKKKRQNNQVATSVLHPVTETRLILAYRAPPHWYDWLIRDLLCVSFRNLVTFLTSTCSFILPLWHSLSLIFKW